VGAFVDGCLVLYYWLKMLRCSLQREQFYSGFAEVIFMEQIEEGSVMIIEACIPYP
jgi:hypothetical protein